MSKRPDRAEKPDEPGEPEEGADKPTMAPFVGALTIVVLVVIAIFAADRFIRDDPTPEDLITRAVIGQNDGLQREDYDAFGRYTCAAARGEEADVVAAQRESVQELGKRFVDDVANVRVDGQRATASVTYSFEKARDDKSTTDVTLAEEDGAWKVCQV